MEIVSVVKDVRRQDDIEIPFHRIQTLRNGNNDAVQFGIGKNCLAGKGGRVQGDHLAGAGQRRGDCRNSGA